MGMGSAYKRRTSHRYFHTNNFQHCPNIQMASCNRSSASAVTARPRSEVRSHMETNDNMQKTTTELTQNTSHLQASAHRNTTRSPKTAQANKLRPTESHEDDIGPPRESRGPHEVKFTEKPGQTKSMPKATKKASKQCVANHKNWWAYLSKRKPVCKPHTCFLKTPKLSTKRVSRRRIA